MASSHVQWHNYHGHLSRQIWLGCHHIPNGCAFLLGKSPIWGTNSRKFEVSYRVARNWTTKNSLVSRRFSQTQKVTKTNFDKFGFFSYFVAFLGKFWFTSQMWANRQNLLKRRFLKSIMTLASWRMESCKKEGKWISLEGCNCRRKKPEKKRTRVLCNSEF